MLFQTLSLDERYELSTKRPSPGHFLYMNFVRLESAGAHTYLIWLPRHATVWHCIWFSLHDGFCRSALFRNVPFRCVTALTGVTLCLPSWPQHTQKAIRHYQVSFISMDLHNISIRALPLSSCAVLNWHANGHPSTGYKQFFPWGTPYERCSIYRGYCV